MNDAIHQQIVTALENDALLVGALGSGRDRIHDRVPPRRNFPFVTIEQLSVADWSTDAEEGHAAIATIRAWSRAKNRNELLAIVDHIIRVVAAMDVSSTIVLSRFLTANYERVQSEKVLRATLRFELLVEREAE